MRAGCASYRLVGTLRASSDPYESRGQAGEGF